MKTNIYKFNSDGGITLAATYVNDRTPKRNMTLFLMLLNKVYEWSNAETIAKFEAKIKEQKNGFITFTHKGFDYFTKNKTED